MRVRFWGVRGSLPTPATGEDVASRVVEALLHLGQSRDAPDLRDRDAVSRWVENLPLAVRSLSGGNTPCVEMTTRNGELFIIDLGSGLRALGNSLLQGPFGRGEGHAHLFLSHFHWDHIQGWPFFRPAYIEGNRFELYARHQNVEAQLKKQQEAPFFPPAAWDDMKAEVRYHTLPDAPITLCNGEVRVSSIELNHPLYAYAFRFEADGQSFVYASDGAFPAPDSAEAQPFIEFFRDADLLVFDAQFTLQESLQKPDWGHSSSVTGVELARRAGAKRLALFHHDPNAGEAHLSDLLDAARYHALISSLPGEVEVLLAREDMEVELGS